MKWSFALPLAVSLVSAPIIADDRMESENSSCPQRRFGQFSRWTDPVNLGPHINSPSNDYHPAVSNNGPTLYFTSNRPGGFSSVEDIWVSQRARLVDGWGSPTHLGGNINSADGTCCPNLSPDQHLLYFASNRPGGFGYRPGGLGDYNLWVSYRADTNDDFGWGPPSNLGPLVHKVGAGECAPTIFKDEQSGITNLYFCRNQGGLGDFDIYVSTLRSDNRFGRPALVFELDSPVRDTRTAIRRDGLEMFVTSNRPGGFGLIDLWNSTRATTLDAWSPPVNLGPTINTTADDGGPALSCDATTLYFYSTRPDGSGGRDLYVTTRQPIVGGDDKENDHEY
jgi:hypothetical protein